MILDRARTLALAVDLVDRAVAEGAELVVFPEAFIAGYPAWVWRLRPGTDWGLSEARHHRLLESAVDLQHGDLEPLTEAAERHGITILCGMHERDAELSRATLYNTYVVIGADGRILNRHRKLMPTNLERMIWGFGDACGLKGVRPGDSIVIAPGGEIVAGPMRQEKGILYADLDTKRIANARRCLDVAGHYARPNIFRLHVDTRPQSPIEFQ